MESAVTCGWFFGAEGVVDITPLYHLNSHHATHLTNYTNLSCTLQLEVKYYNNFLKNNLYAFKTFTGRLSFSSSFSYLQCNRVG